MRQLCILGVVLLLAAPLAAAGTLDVGPPGSGATFDSIQVAVAAAAPGDVILVQPGSYTSIGSLVIDKSLTILGAGSAVVTQTALGATLVDEQTVLVIENLKATDEVRVVGLLLTSSTLIGPGATTLAVSNCEGAVFLSDLVSASGSGFSGSLGAGIISTSQQVSMDACEFSASMGAASGGAQTPLGAIGQAGLWVVDSTLTLNDCTIMGATRGVIFFTPSHSGGTGILSSGSTVRVSRSEIRGGQGGSNLIDGLGGAGGPAISGTGSQLHLSGGPGNLLVGGDGGFSASVGGVLVVPPGASALFVAAGSTATAAADVVLVPGIDGDNVTLAPSVDGTGVFTSLGERLATLVARPILVTLGASASLQFGGEPGSSALAFFSLDQSLALAFPGILGEVLVSPAAVIFFQPVTLDPAGAGQLSFNLPTSPVFVGQSALFQMLAVSSSGLSSFSSATLLAIF